MSVAVNLTYPTVFVDDHDPAIVYSNGYLSTTRISTVMNMSTLPSSNAPPYYGTLHTTHNHFNGFPTFWYIFNGTDFEAYFFGQSVAKPLCTIDGVNQTAVSGPGAGQFFCINNTTLSQGQHNLSVQMSPLGMSFDGLRYWSNTLPDSSVDLSYNINIGLTPLGEDHTYTINFDGNSIALYLAFTFNSTIDTTSFSYLIDDGPPLNFPPLNFSVSNPTQDPTWNGGFEEWLFVQTPSLPRGSHTFRLTIAEDVSNVGTFTLSQVIVQNTTKSFTLDAVPSIPVLNVSLASPLNHPTASTTFTQSVPQINIGAIAGGVLSGVFMLLIGFWIWKRALRKQVQAVNHRDSIVQPFSAPDPLQIGRFPLAQYTTMEKTSKYREVFGLTPDRSGSSEDVRDAEEVRTEDTLPPAETRPVRYRFHEDGGQVTDSQRDELDDDADIISLPPIYSTLGQPSTDSLIAESLASHDITNPSA